VLRAAARHRRCRSTGTMRDAAHGSMRISIAAVSSRRGVLTRWHSTCILHVPCQQRTKTVRSPYGVIWRHKGTKLPRRAETAVRALKRKIEGVRTWHESCNMCAPGLSMPYGTKCGRNGPICVFMLRQYVQALKRNCVQQLTGSGSRPERGHAPLFLIVDWILGLGRPCVALAISAPHGSD